MTQPSAVKYLSNAGGCAEPDRCNGPDNIGGERDDGHSVASYTTFEGARQGCREALQFGEPSEYERYTEGKSDPGEWDSQTSDNEGDNDDAHAEDERGEECYFTGIGMSYKTEDKPNFCIRTTNCETIWIEKGKLHSKESESGDTSGTSDQPPGKKTGAKRSLPERKSQIATKKSKKA